MQYLRINKICILLFIISKSLLVLAQNISESNNELLIGKLYQERTNKIDGHPFLINSDFHPCTLIYKDIEFKNLLIKYDLLNQQIILYQQVDSIAPPYIILNNNMIKNFSLRFDYRSSLFSSDFSKIPELNNKIKFYEVIHNGKTKYIVGRIKTIKELAINNEIDSYVLNQYYYLIINNSVLRIRNKKDILNAFPLYKKELKSFIKRNKLKIKVDNFSDIDLLLSFCDNQLIK